MLKIHGRCMEKDNLFGKMNLITMEVLTITKDVDMLLVNLERNLRKK